jgi:malate dehydrogenase
MPLISEIGQSKASAILYLNRALSKATRNGLNISSFLSKERLNKIIEQTKVGGATLTSMLGTSAWYAPGAAVAFLVDSILNDYKRMIPCSVLLEGEYGLSDICIGVPCIIGSDGVQSIVDIKLNEMEQALLKNSAEKVQIMNDALKDIL